MADVDRDRVVAALRTLGPRHAVRYEDRDGRVLRGIVFRSRVERRRRARLAAGMGLVVAGGLASLVGAVTGWWWLVAVDVGCAAAAVGCLAVAYRAGP